MIRTAEFGSPASLSNHHLVSQRMGRDSNPRWTLAHSGFQDRRLRPLGHPSRYPYSYGLLPCSFGRAQTYHAAKAASRFPTVPSYAGLLAEKGCEARCDTSAKRPAIPKAKPHSTNGLPKGVPFYGTHGKTLPARRPDMENASRTTKTSTGVCGGTAEARERLRQPLTELRQQGGSRLRRDMGEEGIVKKWERTPPLFDAHCQDRPGPFAPAHAIVASRSLRKSAD